MSLRETRREALRERLLQATMELLLAGEWDGVRTEVVAERAGVSRATLFNYFPRREELVLELARRRLAGMQQRLSQATASRSGQRAVKRAMVEQLAAFSEENERLPDALRASFLQMLGSPGGREALAPTLLGLRATVAQALAGSGKATAEANQQAGLVMAIYFGTQVEWLVEAAAQPGLLRRRTKARLTAILQEQA